MKKSSKKSKPKSSVKAAKSSPSRPSKQNFVKPLFILVIVLLLIFGVMYKAKNKQMRNEMPTADSKISASQWLSEMLMKSNSMNVPEVTPEVQVSLNKKTTEFEGGTITLGDKFTGDKEHIFTTVAVSTGGTGEFIYLVAFDKMEDTYKMSSFVPLGDRVAVDSLMADGSTVSVSYRTHGEDQPMAEEPDMKMDMKYTYMNGTFTEVK